MSFLLFGAMLTSQPSVMAEEGMAPAEEQNAPAPSKAEGAPETSYSYRFENRQDPFLPFLTEKATPVAPSNIPDQILPTSGQLTGMQLFEPGQLTLVAIVMAEDYDFAMVEDTIGKGYIIRQGTKIGERGEVTLIEPNQVTITETAQTQSGKTLESKVVMLLNKEGEE